MTNKVDHTKVQISKGK